MNFFWRQNIVGLLRHAAEGVPEIGQQCLEVAKHLDRTLTSPYLDQAFALFQDAALRTHDPVYVTGAFYTMRALDEVTRWEEQAGGAPQPSDAEELSYRLAAAAGMTSAYAGTAAEREDGDDRVSHEVDRGIMELFERIRAGASLDEALALFPHVGDEHSPD